MLCIDGKIKKNYVRTLFRITFERDRIESYHIKYYHKNSYYNRIKHTVLYGIELHKLRCLSRIESKLYYINLDWIMSNISPSYRGLNYINILTVINRSDLYIYTTSYRFNKSNHEYTIKYVIKCKIRSKIEPLESWISISENFSIFFVKI